ncbi:unnamed protein product [Moneuplotes crassus]|uniref:Uncharacterized protein n=1 Tax=Euplotes crassus TaxID=5936 RepID=A0AAD2D586_EUPCR|nr:unnamed protein product [Moneuplotes crassus]
MTNPSSSTVNLDTEIALFYTKLNTINKELVYLQVTMGICIFVAFLVGAAGCFCLMKCRYRRLTRQIEEQKKKLKEKQEDEE